MLEQIIYDITRGLLNKTEIDADALYFHLGSEEMTQEIINGIQRAITDYQLSEYEG